MKKLALSFLYTIFASLIFFAFNFYIAKILGAKVYGEISYYLSFVSIISLLISLNYASLYMGSKITQNNKNSFSLFITLQTILLFIFLIPIYFVLKIYIDSNLIIFLIVANSYFLVIISTISLEYNANKNITTSIMVKSLLPRVLLVILFLLFIVLNYNKAIHYLIAFLIANFLVLVYFLTKIKVGYYYDKSLFKRAWKFYLLGIIGASFKPLANILQKEYYGYVEVANLSIAMLFLAGFYLIGTVLVKFVLPKVHEAWRSKDIKTIEKLYANNTLLEVLLISPLVVLVLLNGDLIVKFLGSSYSLLPNYILILMIGFIPDLFTGITGNLLRATENEKYEIFNEILVIVSGLSLIYILKDYKYGVVWAISISNFLYNIAKFLEVYWLLKIKPFNLKKFLLLIAYIILLISILYYTLLLNSSYIRYVVLLLIVAVVYYLNYRFIKKYNLLRGFE